MMLLYYLVYSLYECRKEKQNLTTKIEQLVIQSNSDLPISSSTINTSYATDDLRKNINDNTYSNQQYNNLVKELDDISQDQLSIDSINSNNQKLNKNQNNLSNSSNSSSTNNTSSGRNTNGLQFTNNKNRLRKRIITKNKQNSNVNTSSPTSDDKKQYNADKRQRQSQSQSQSQRQSKRQSKRHSSFTDFSDYNYNSWSFENTSKNKNV